MKGQDIVHDQKETLIVVGSKQTKRALEKGVVHTLYLAKNASEDLVAALLKSAKTHQVHVQFFETMAELGVACHVGVETASAAIIKQIHQ